jgi:hypothetical protein
MRAILVAAASALAFAAAAHADAPAAGPYHLDSHGACHAAKGQSVPASLCHVIPPPACKAGVTKLCHNACIAVADVCHPH